ncbi:MAG: peptidoglycan synthetase [Bacteroidetes bacterium]|nr:peptidoglycan synthetase [Bacteroidota bacterium]MBL6942990.1 peptidoglycan synthetase [Bacteroidales bacterium]
MKIHFIAIGGSAMHNLAIALKIVGHSVSGSDDEIFEPSLSRLADNNLLPKKFGWHPENISQDIDAIILGMHAKQDNPELARAIELGLRIYSYPEFLYNHSKNKKRIVIGGSHGKTTITAMIMHVLRTLNYDFDYLVGSKIKDFDVMVRLSDTAPIMIFEGDEYLSSPIDRRPKFHWYSPDIALLSGIAWDHINVFPTNENYISQFEKFISLIKDNGSLIYYQNDSKIEELAIAQNNLTTIPYGIPEYRIRNGIYCILTDNGEVELGIFGKHNMININGAKLVCRQLGIYDKEFFDSIKSFEGTANRLELVSSNGNSRLYKDFAHAPSKVRATVEAVREQFPEMNFVACLELHTFSSLNKDFIHEYQHTLELPNHACVYFDEHTLAMKRLPDLSVHDVEVAFGRKNLKVFVNSKDMTDWLILVKKPDTVFLMMSSGNFDGINFEELAKMIVPLV